MSRVEHLSDDVTLYLGDCRDILPTLGKVDAVVTDPPYGVNLGKSASNKRLGNGNGYNSFEDTPEYIREVCVKAVSFCVERFPRVVMTPGQKCSHLYPQPDDIGCWFNPAGSSAGSWGWLTSHLVFYYGKNPNTGKYISATSVTGLAPSLDDGKFDHPCPKPLSFMKWMVGKASRAGETILDPFLGSGTTGVACVQLGRKFIGIELEPKYFDIACKRISDELKRPRLDLGEPVQKPVQEALL